MISPSHNSLQKDPVPPLVKVAVIAKLLSASRTTVRNLIDAGELEASQINRAKHRQRRHMRVTRSSLMKFYKKRFGHSLSDVLDNPFESRTQRP